MNEIEERGPVPFSVFADRSRDINELSKDLVPALGELEDIIKSQTASGASFSYKYATISDVLGSVRPILAKHNIAIFQTANTDRRDVTIWTTLMHVSGQYITHMPLILPAGENPQKTGSAITYGRRYSLLAALGLATEDDDGEAASTPPKKTQAPSSWGSAPKPKATPAPDFTTGDKIKSDGGERGIRSGMLSAISALRTYSPSTVGNTNRFLKDNNCILLSDLPFSKMEELHKMLLDIQKLGPDAEYNGE